MTGFSLDRESRENVVTLMQRLRDMNDAEYLQCLIAYHAAPTLQGLKPATLICPGAGWRDLRGALEECGPRLFTAFGVRIASFTNHAGSLLLLIYNPLLLKNTLAAREVAELLAEAGYEIPDGSVEPLLAHLSRKCCCKKFPHEIGVFLGYPPADVRRFMAEGGQSCPNAGCWKAFGDAAGAATSSARFRRAKLLAAKLIVGGADLGEMAMGLRLAV